MKILIGYATLHGSTRSIAENIGRAIGAWYPTTVRSIETVEHLRDYDAVVIGSTLRDGAWLPSAREFLSQNAGVLSAKPLWMFSVWLPSALPGPLHRAMSRAQARSLAAAVPPGIHPREIRLFGGALRPEQVPALTDRVRLHALGIRYGDFRPWPEVMAWARQIAATLDEAHAA